MNGLITHKHLITQAHEIFVDYGWRIYLHCLLSVLKREKKTFLQVLVESHYFDKEGNNDRI